MPTPRPPVGGSKESEREDLRVNGTSRPSSLSTHS